MIFISLGTQKFQLNRLLVEIDNLIENGTIKDNVFAQIGNSTYQPKNYEYIDFLSQQDFDEKIFNCNIFITHGGVGSIMNGLKHSKKTIVFPRLAIYKEHVDDHQLDIANKFNQLGYCLVCNEEQDLKSCLNKINDFESKFSIRNSNNSIEQFILDYLSKLK